jgi:uncharacterized protein YegP (UPF0339 family)
LLFKQVCCYAFSPLYRALWHHFDAAGLSTGKDDKFYFNLRAASGQVILSSQGYTSKVIGKSQMYKSNESSENGIESVKTNTRLASVSYLQTTEEELKKGRRSLCNMISITGYVAFAML